VTTGYLSGMKRLRISRVLGAAALAASLALVALLIAMQGPSPARAGLQTFRQDSLVIETAAGQRHRFTVELALSSAQHAQGLMYRRMLAPDAGMLFLYGHERDVMMWMKNTLIPLDMLFIAADGRVVRIAERAVPGSLETIPSGKPVTAVLELNGGTAARLGIAAGDRVRYAAFGTGP